LERQPERDVSCIYHNSIQTLRYKGGSIRCQAMDKFKDIAKRGLHSGKETGVRGSLVSYNVPGDLIRKLTNDAWRKT
jgi:hypothetical protein